MNHERIDRSRDAMTTGGGCRSGGASIAHQLVRRAARHAPPQWAERLEEEWLADLAERRGAVSRLRFAVGCWWASRVIASDAVTTVVAASSGTSGQHVLTHRSLGHGAFSGRSLILMLIIGAHLALIFGLARGLGTVVTEVLQQPAVATIKQLLPHPLDTPRLPQPQLTWKQHAFDIPTPEIQLDSPVESEEAPPGVSVQPAAVDSAPPTPTPERAVRTQGGPGRDFPNADDFYPPGAIRDGEAGSATVRVCVDRTGRLTTAPVLAESTGYPRLDAGALKLARAGSGRYRPTLENGQPVSACYPFRIRFSLK
jgi:TonB family protein